MSDQPNEPIKTDAKPRVKLPPKTVLAELDTLEAQLEQDAAERAKQAREAKRKLIEKHHVHTEAFAMARKLKSMEPTERNAWLRHLAHYVEAFGLDKQLDLLERPVSESVDYMAQVGAVEGTGGRRA